MYVVAFIMLLVGIDCFNIDTNNVVNILGPEGTDFGYSAVMFSNEESQKWIVIGAIKANFTNDQNITTPGNIFKCKLNFTKSTQECEPMNLRTNDSRRWQNLPGYEEDNELLGAAMSIFDETIITCAPLWKDMIPLKHSDFVHPIGRCFNMDRNLQSYTTKYFTGRLFRNKFENLSDYYFAQIGLSISNKKFEDNSWLNILIGATGFLENEGGFLQYTGNLTIDDFSSFFTRLDFAEDAVKQSLHHGSLMGYSISTGKLYNSDEECPGVIVLGAPKSTSENRIVGGVFVFCLKQTDKKLYLKKMFVGEKSGSGFGTSIVFEDINGDGLDDLLVGAPLHYNDVLDSGVVHIYYGDTDPHILLRASEQKLQGMSEWGRFGTALQCIGDINKDGYKDVVIGAPYEESNQGAIYIYHGGYDKLTYTQKIKAQDISSNIQSFGWYISTAYDIDNNKYQDFLVGSYMSNTVTVLRGRPIIKLNNTIELFPSDIPLNSSALKCRNELYRPCVTVRLCFSYTGVSVPDSILVDYNLSSDIRRTLSTPSKPTRVHLSSETEVFGSGNLEEKRFQVRKLSESCIEYFAIVTALDRQFFASLEEELVMETTYRLSDTSILGEVQPVLDNDLTINRDKANFSTGCNETCHPDLQIESTIYPQEIIIGETSEIDVTVKVTNKGDLSHGTRIKIHISDNIRYIAFSQPTNEVTESVDCRNIIAENKESHVQCDLRNTLSRRQIVIVNARFIVSRDILLKDGENLGNFEQQIVFNTLVEATSTDMNISDNSWKLIAIVKLHVSVELNGISRPDQLTITKNDKVNFVHTYYIKNDGPSPLYNGSISICLPVTSDDGTSMITKEMIQISGHSSKITWRVVEFAGEIFNGKSTQSRIRRETEQMLKEISCNTVSSSNHAIIEIKIDLLEKDKTDTFDVQVNILEESLNFTKVAGIVYKSLATLKSENNSRQLITVTDSSIIEASSEIYPTEVTVDTVKSKQNNQGITIGSVVGGLVGGLLLLVIRVLILKKFGFFKRQKKELVEEWKRKSKYYEKSKTERIPTAYLMTSESTALLNYCKEFCAASEAKSNDKV
ncbi:integrin alpha-4-like [Mytilus galloprovincialis]|uniref:integrin alpha-4-like n=1 Tax=Mytilus galloprovincialis TaxID=29158 RepID=UPI003F7C483B